jgi:hypothetical protein
MRVYRMYQELDLVTIATALRLKWLGHINRMEDHREPKRALQSIAGGWVREKERKKEVIA